MCCGSSKWLPPCRQSRLSRRWRSLVGPLARPSVKWSRIYIYILKGTGIANAAAARHILPALKRAQRHCIAGDARWRCPVLYAADPCSSDRWRDRCNNPPLPPRPQSGPSARPARCPAPDTCCHPPGPAAQRGPEAGPGRPVMPSLQVVQTARQQPAGRTGGRVLRWHTSSTCRAAARPPHTA